MFPIISIVFNLIIVRIALGYVYTVPPFSPLINAVRAVSHTVAHQVYKRHKTLRPVSSTVPAPT